MSVKKIIVAVTALVIIAGCMNLPVTGQQPDVTAPRNLRATGYDGYVQLEWQAPAFGGERVNEYRIYRSLSDQKFYYTSVGSNTHSLRDDDVENGRTYYYWVTAIYDEDRETGFSNEATATPVGISPPTPPKNLRAYQGNIEVQLKWEAPDDDGGAMIMNYHIYRGPSSDELEMRYIVGTTGEYSDKEVVNGQTYYYGVKAVNDRGASDISNIVSATPSADITVPSAPRNLRTLVGNRLIELYWEPPLDDGGSPIQSYRIERTSEQPGQQHRIFNSEYAFYSDDSVTNYETYTYNVRAVNIEGRGPSSNEVMATPTMVGIPPSIGDLDAQASSNGIYITWSEPDTEVVITSYNLYRGRSEDDMVFLTNIIGSTHFEDHLVEGGKTYYYMVRTVSEDKLSLESNIDSATVRESYSPTEDDDGKIGLPFLALLIGLLVAIVVIVFIFAFLKKKQKPTASEPITDKGWQHEPEKTNFQETEADSSTHKDTIERKEDDEWTIRS